MEINVIKKMIELLEGSSLKKIHLRDGDFEISLEKDDLQSTKKSVAFNPAEKPGPVDESLPIEKKGEEKKYILSPMVGTFYSSSSPENPSFVKIGDKVEENTIICIIEAMKVMNEIKANKKGIIKEILIENAQPVEFGSKLFLVEP